VPSAFKYVDKTPMLAKIMGNAGEQCILAPAMRRIGKTTTVAMLAAMARGEREKFVHYAVGTPGTEAHRLFPVGAPGYVFPVIQLSFKGLAGPRMTIEQFETDLYTTCTQAPASSTS
jgi:hypothetical protein